jgi:hypothetical protein
VCECDADDTDPTTSPATVVRVRTVRKECWLVASGLLASLLAPFAGPVLLSSGAASITAWVARGVDSFRPSATGTADGANGAGRFDRLGAAGWYGSWGEVSAAHSGQK